jgi:hypothetical protein
MSEKSMQGRTSVPSMSKMIPRGVVVGKQRLCLIAAAESAIVILRVARE